jgi:hypothetical protein
MYICITGIHWNPRHPRRHLRTSPAQPTLQAPSDKATSVPAHGWTRNRPGRPGRYPPDTVRAASCRIITSPSLDPLSLQVDVGPMLQPKACTAHELAGTCMAVQAYQAGTGPCFAMLGLAGPTRISSWAMGVGSSRWVGPGWQVSPGLVVQHCGHELDLARSWKLQHVAAWI